MKEAESASSEQISKSNFDRRYNELNVSNGLDHSFTVEIIVKSNCLAQRWASYGPRDYFMRPAGTYKILTPAVNQAKDLFSLIFSGKEDI